MLRIFAIIFFAILTQVSQAQKPPIKFGDIPLDQLKMTRYEKDSSASAVILADFGQSIIVYVNGIGFVLSFSRVRRIKILRKEGLDFGNYKILLYHDSKGNVEKLTELKAVTYNYENDQLEKQEMKSDAIFKEKYDDRFDLINFALPNVKVGSVIEITYKISSDFFFHFQEWKFQNIIPVVWSEYRATIPEYFTYNKYMEGYVSLTVNEEQTSDNSLSINEFEKTRTIYSFPVNEEIHFKEKKYRWAGSEIPALKEEPRMNSYESYLSKIRFELAFTKFPNSGVETFAGDWGEISNQYAKSPDFGGAISGNNFLKKIVENIIGNHTSNSEKIKLLQEYVKNNFSWDGRNRESLSSDLGKVFKDKKGNSADINLLLAAMLEKAKLNVSPVLLSTRDNGIVRETSPNSLQFNYVVCLVKLNGQNILLDATDKLLPGSLLPERCLNGRGLVVNRDDVEWVNLQPSIKSKTVINVDLNFAKAAELKGNLQIERTHYDAFRSRTEYFSKGEEGYLKDFLGSRSWKIIKSEFQNAGEIQQSFKEFHEIIINDHISSAGEMIYLNPFVMDREEENPFKLEKREYPVDFGRPFDRMYLLKIKVPESYNIEELPKSKVLMLPNSTAKYYYNATQTGNTINISSNLVVTRSLFTQDEYANLKEFYNQVVAKQAEQIVLKKK